MSTVTPVNKALLPFFLLVFVLSIPFWWIGAITGVQLLPGLPVSALGFICPAAAAVLFIYKENKAAGVIGLLKRAYDYERIRTKIWYLPIVLLVPGVFLLSFELVRLLGSPVPTPRFTLQEPLVLFLIFFIAALGEELGWSGYAIDPIQARWTALPAGILLGLVWAAWHLIPLLQVYRQLEWIAWWFLYTVAARVLITWIYNNTGKSVFAATLFHAMMNVSWQLFPVDGSYFDPRITGLILTVAAAIVIALWGPRTLARYGIAR
jgi:uncharacterized protein